MEKEGEKKQSERGKLSGKKVREKKNKIRLYVSSKSFFCFP